MVALQGWNKSTYAGVTTPFGASRAAHELPADRHSFITQKITGPGWADLAKREI